MAQGVDSDFTEQQVLEAIKGSLGVITRIANKLNVNWNTADKYIKMYPTCIEALKMERETIKDRAEMNLYKAIYEDEDVQTSKWYLGIMARDRGYIEKVDINHSGKVDNVITVSKEDIENLKANMQYLAEIEKKKNDKN